jgi:hypothetical protein
MMNVVAIIQAAAIAAQAAVKIADAIKDAVGDDPAQPLEPIIPLNYEADKKLKEATMGLREAADKVESGLKS